MCKIYNISKYQELRLWSRFLLEYPKNLQEKLAMREGPIPHLLGSHAPTYIFHRFWFLHAVQQESMPGKAVPNKPQTMVLYCFSTTDIFSSFWNKKVENTFCISQSFRFRNSNCELNNLCLVRDKSCQCDMPISTANLKQNSTQNSPSKSYSTSILPTAQHKSR